MINRSLVAKLWLAIVALVVIILFFLGVFLSQFFEDFYFSLKADELRDNGVKIADMIASAPEPELWQEELSMISKYIDAKIVITDRSGLIRACNMAGKGMQRGTRIQYPDVEKILKGEVVAQRGTYPGIDITVLSVGVPIKSGDEVIGAVFLNSPVEPVTHTVRTVQKFILYGAIGAIFLATVIAFFMSKSIIKPILNMNTIAMEMAKGNFKEKVNIDSDDEIGLLGNTLNFLSFELEKNIDALSTEKDQLENILTSMTDAVLTIDNSGNILLMNPPARKLFNLGAGEECVNIKDCRVIPELRENFMAVLCNKIPVKGDINIGKSTFTFGMTPLRHKNGDIRGVVAVLHDFTKEKRLEMLRRDFVANVSHELRSPLSLLQGYVEALADGLAENEAERQKYLNILLDETLRLRRLVNDLLDLTHLETGNLSMKKEKISVEDIVNRVTNRLKPMFAEQNKELVVSLPEKLPFIIGDDDKIQQVLVNLLDNAMKYTPVGGIVKVGANNLNDKVEIYVEDSGPGIPKDELEHIWERFYKVDKARTREVVGGTGLGLAIVKNIVHALGGEVKVTSQPEKGSRFSFTVKTADVKIESDSSG